MPRAEGIKALKSYATNIDTKKAFLPIVVPEMGRNLSPLVQEELERLEKDAESRRLAIKALKSYATNIDTKAIPQFLAQVSETNNQGSTSGECIISLYEVLARVHGHNIVPQIGNIMTTIIRTLSTSAGSFPLHQACSKVVPAIARYGIEPSTPDDEKKRIICSLSAPLSNVLMNSHQSLASGSALCLKTLVESSNWKFASDATINDVCLKVACALEQKMTQTTSHMGLAMALAKHNSSVAEAYSGSLIRSGLHMLRIGNAENNSQKRFTAIQMINFLMKCIDSRSICLELAEIADAMNKCQADDDMAYVRGAAFEAIQTVKFVSSRSIHKCEISSTPLTHLNHHRKNEKNPEEVLDKLAKTIVDFSSSPESHTMASSTKQENFVESPNSINQAIFKGDHLCKRAPWMLWNNNHSGLDLSFKDSFLKVEAHSVKDAGCHETSHTNNQQVESFTGFMLSNAENTVSGDTTPSDQNSLEQLAFNNIMTYTTPRKLIRSLQTQNDSKKELSLSVCRVHEPTDDSCPLNSVSPVCKQMVIDDAEEVRQSIESVSSTADPTDDKGCEAIDKCTVVGLKGIQIRTLQVDWYKKSVLAFISVLAVIWYFNILRDDSDKYSYGLAPT